mmetsp:Transcript_87091/g.154089  ORF Transcript_87091/g.154089 Transcript_87091/m.154089 type:complete len:375 (+) Transcript_87091:25-1149(+)
MQWPGLPGVTIDVAALLESLSPSSLTSALKAAGASAGETETVTLKAPGLVVSVPDVLRALDKQTLLAAVQHAVKSWPSSIGQATLELAQNRPLATTSVSSLKLPQIGQSSPKKPPRLPNSEHGLSKSTGSLPARPPEGELLLQAIRDKNLPKVQELLASRVDVETCDSNGVRPISLAMGQGVPSGILKCLLDSKANTKVQDHQNRALIHLWSWNLPRSKTSAKEEQKKLALLAAHKVDLNATLPVTGDTAMHILARVFNTLRKRAEDETSSGPCPPQINSIEAERFSKNTELRLQLLANAGASVSIHNATGQVPLELVDTQFWPLVPVLGGSTAAAAAAGGKSASYPIPEPSRHARSMVSVSSEGAYSDSTALT